MARGNWRNWDLRAGAEAKKQVTTRPCRICGLPFHIGKEMSEHMKTHRGII